MSYEPDPDDCPRRCGEVRHNGPCKEELLDCECSPQPIPGDVIRLEGSYDVLVASGSRAVIDSVHFGADFDDGKGPRVLAVFSASVFRGPGSGTFIPTDREYVSCSGGPCPLVPIKDLVHVGTTLQRFWRWKDRPRAQGGEDYSCFVQEFTWAGTK